MRKSKTFIAFLMTAIMITGLHTFAQQDSCTVTALPLFEDFTSFATGYIPDTLCWKKHAQYTGYYGYPTITAQGLNSSNCLRLPGTGSYSGIATPPLAETFSMSELMVSFYLKVSQTANHLIVGVMTDATDENTFIPVDTVYNPTTADFYLHHVYLNNYTDSGRHIAFRWLDNDDLFTATYALVDDITIQLTSPCAMVAQLRVSEITGNTARLVWEEGPLGTPNSYTVAYQNPDSSMTVVYNVTDHELVLSNLEHNTSYTVYVTTNCDSDYVSHTDSISFTTACMSGGDLIFGHDPYVSAHSFPACKYALSEEIYTASDLGGARNLQSLSLYCTSVGVSRNVSVYLMPVVQTTLTHFINVDASATKVYDGVVSPTTGWFTIYFDDNYYYDGANNLMLIIDDNTGTTGSNSAFHFANSPEGNMIRISNSYYTNYNPANTNNYNGTIYHYRHQIRFNDVCDNLTNCVAPYVTIGAVSDTLAEVNIYSGNGDDQWTVEHRRCEDSLWTTANYVVGSPYYLTGLEPNTLYQVRVNPDCSGAGPDHWTTRTFHTDCGPMRLPYSEHFDECAVTDGDFLRCWRRYSTLPAQQAHVATNLAQAHSGEHYLAIPTVPNDTTVVVLPEITALPLDSLQVEFYLSHPGNAILEIGAMTDPDDVSTFQTIDTLSAYYENTYEMISYSLHHYTDSGRHIAFRVSDGTGGELRLDDLIISAAEACYVPLSVTVQHIDAFSAEISWTEAGNASQWSIEYGVNGFTPGTGTVVVADTNPFLLTGLLANHTYNFYLRSDCDSTHHSDWTNVYTFDTPCFEIDHFPFSEDFNSPGTGNGHHDLPECWSRLDYPYPNIYGGSLCFNYNANIVVLPRLAEHSLNGDTIDIRLLRLDLTANYYDASDRVTVGVMTDPDDASTFQPVKEIVTAYNYTSTYRPAYVYFYEYFGTGRYIAIKNKQGSYAHVDNFVLSSIDFSCAAPDSLQISEIGRDNAMVTWMAGQLGDPMEYVVQYALQGDSNWVTAADHLSIPQFLLTGLTPHTWYDVRVRTRCTDSTFGAWTTTTFVTECMPVDTFPITENFDQLDRFPDCWFQEYVTGTLDWEVARPNYCPYNSHSPLKAIRLRNENSNSNECTRLITPYLQLQGQPHVMLKFWHYHHELYTGKLDTLAIQYRTSPSAPWVTLSSYNYDLTYWKQDSVLIPGNSDSVQIAFMAKLRQGYGVYLDDISVSEWQSDVIEPCEPVTGFAATEVGNEYIKLTWTQTSAPGDYGYLNFRKETAPSWDSVLVTTPPYTLNGLEPNTTYMLFIRSYCTAGTPASSVDTLAITTTNVGIPRHAEGITLLPNPTEGILTVASAQSPIQYVEISNLSGRVLLRRKIHENTVRIDLSELSDGIYFAKIITCDGISVHKVIKQR